MINLTKEIMVMKSGEDLSLAIKEAITKAKECVCKDLFDETYISPSKITSSPRNLFYNASIVRLFNDHTDTSAAPSYDENWVGNIYACSKKTPDISLAKKVTPKASHDWLNKSSLERLSQDSILILHFLWHVGAVLLPLDTKKPTVGNPENIRVKGFEFAARTYPEVLAFVSQPFITHIKYDGIPDITSVMKPSSIKNFGWNAWRLIRATTWYCVEDIETDDVIACINKLLEARREEADWFRYPIAPKALVSYIQKLYPERCNVNLADHKVKNHLLATKTVIEKGEFYIPDEYIPCSNAWLKYQDKYIAILKTRGMKTFDAYQKTFGPLNSYILGELPTNSGCEPPFPKDFNRRHIEGDGFEGLVSYIQKGRSKSTCKGMLYKISGLFDYMAANANLDPDLNGFVNPLSTIDFPFVSRNSATNKAAFSAEHFPILLQFSYAIESFAWYLTEKVHHEHWNLYAKEFRVELPSGDWNSAHKVIQTDKLGFVPLVFFNNPSYDPSQPVTKENRRMRYAALHYLPRFIIPLQDRQVTNADRLNTYPQLNYIQHNIVALETGIRTMHIRWLDRRTYDKHIDRSRPLAPICKLHVNTDKSHDVWEATVSTQVIEILDRQKSTHQWFDEPVIHEEIWYDGHENSPFGKVLPLFPRGMAASGTPMAGPFNHDAYSRYFKRLIFTFDLFCRYQLDMDATNPLPEAFADIDMLDTVMSYADAIRLEKEACKLIEHTPHSCRVSVVSEYIKILPPDIIGNHITGHATVAHVMYYAKVDPAYLQRHKEYQKLAFEHGGSWDNSLFSQIKAEDINSKLQQAFKKDKNQSLVDFGAISFDRETDAEILTGLKALKQRPLEALAFMPTHICPFGNNCPKEVIKDLGAIPGERTPCGGCYYSIKTVDHLPRILGHIRTLTEECTELESYIAEAKKQGASTQSLAPKANYRRFLAAEIISWSVTVHCLEQMYKEIRTRSNFLIEKPEIVTEQLEKIVVDDNSLANLIARTAEASTHAEYFTPQLKHQIIVARNKLLAFTGDFNRLLQEAPKGFSLLDEFRGLIRATCETLGLSFDDLALALDKPLAMERPDTVLRLISQVGGGTV